jgi:hypothetical protein
MLHYFRMLCADPGREVFDTELKGIAGVGSEPESSSSTANPSSQSTMSSSTATSELASMTSPTAKGSAEEEEAVATIQTSSPTATSVVSGTDNADTPDSPLSGQDSSDDSGECRLLGPFALIVQAALGLLALLSLVWKRYRERPRRPLLIWFFDASKQVFGSALLHLVNLAMSMLSDGSMDVSNNAAAVQASGTDSSGRQPNQCSFYLLNLAIDVSLSFPSFLCFSCNH